MRIFLGGAVSVASDAQLEKYNTYKEILSEFGTLTTPDDIWEFRQNEIDSNPDKSKIEIDKMMVEFDLDLIKNADIMICDISEQSTGMGLELGVVYENNIDIVFCYKKGSYVSNMITGAFFDKKFIEYKDVLELKEKLKNVINKNK